ncbi:MAG TPA: sulfatase, partial [Verrucomicrobiae bacterium]|nr:sulfatase [Verrucomicrobiae bacterium]
HPDGRLELESRPVHAELTEASSRTSPDGHSVVSLLQGGAAGEWRNMALIEHHRPFPDPTDSDAPMLHASNPTSYAAVRTERALYVEYEDGEIGYYDLLSDPEALTNVASRLPAAARERWHDILRANKECRGERACWDAQRLTP